MYTAVYKLHLLLHFSFHDFTAVYKLRLLLHFSFHNVHRCLQITLIALFFFSQCTPLSTNYAYCSIFSFHNVHCCQQITLIAAFSAMYTAVYKSRLLLHFSFNNVHRCLQLTLIAPFFFSQCTPLSTKYTYCSIFLFTM